MILEYSYEKSSGGCALARKESVAAATALGASVLQAERFFLCACTLLAHSAL